LGIASSSNLIWIDRDAAGYGWNVSPSGATDTTTGAVDLVSVVTHELGHAIGLSHSEDVNSVMYACLAAGDARVSINAQDFPAGQPSDGGSQESPFISEQSFALLPLLGDGDLVQRRPASTIPIVPLDIDDTATRYLKYRQSAGSTTAALFSDGGLGDRFERRPDIRLGWESQEIWKEEDRDASPLRENALRALAIDVLFGNDAEDATLETPKALDLVLGDRANLRFDAATGKAIKAVE
jgi:hypothetical protein